MRMKLNFKCKLDSHSVVTESINLSEINKIKIPYNYHILLYTIDGTSTHIKLPNTSSTLQGEGLGGEGGEGGEGVEITDTHNQLQEIDISSQDLTSINYISIYYHTKVLHIKNNTTSTTLSVPLIDNLTIQQNIISSLSNVISLNTPQFVIKIDNFAKIKIILTEKIRYNYLNKERDEFYITGPTEINLANLNINADNINSITILEVQVMIIINLT